MNRKSTNLKSKCKVYYQDLYGKRESKYDFLWQNSIETVKWKKLNPKKDLYYFTIKDFNNSELYNTFIDIRNIFNINSIGIASGKDIYYVKFDENEFHKKEKKLVKDYFYRPFDIRKILYDIDKLQRARFTIMQHVKNDNKIICISRFQKNYFPQVLLTKNLVCRHSVSDMTYAFPLYVYNENENNNNKNDFIFKDDRKRDNFTNEFRNFIKTKYKKKYTPEQILGYIYAVLHSPTYRTKYIEFLKIDFPRIPFTNNENLFKELSAIGIDLIEHHLLKKSYADNICKMKGTGENYKVEKVEYEKGKVWINKDRYFEPVPEQIWNFYIGGYQVLDKWLKERKKHEITLAGEDIQHFIKVVNVLDYTIKAMNEIDGLTKKWI